MSHLKNFCAIILVCFCTNLSLAQTYKPFVDAVIKEETNNPYIETFANELINGIGPRLVGTPQLQQAHEWAIAKYKSWGIDARNEKWGEYNGWERGITHVDMVSPRIKSLEASQLAKSPGMDKPITAEVVSIPNLPDAAAAELWLKSIQGKFVLLSSYQPTGWPDDEWIKYTTRTSFEKMKKQRDSVFADLAKRKLKIINKPSDFNDFYLTGILENAGIAGILVNNWNKNLGADRIIQTSAKKVPVIDIGLEDYAMLYHLAETGYKPTINVDVQSKTAGVVPAYNTIAEIKGKIPDEYVMLSAHLDSWDGGSGATDNGTGTIMMMEAMRLLKKFYPNPKRTILAGHWGSEEYGTVGSRAFVEDHPEIVKNIQVLFNHDNGTGRIDRLSGRGYQGAGAFLSRWLAATPIPDSIKKIIIAGFPGGPTDGGSSDHLSFGSVGVPAFMALSHGWSYLTSTWHTNKDTYDKIVFDDVRYNATVMAILVYMACEDTEKISKPENITLPRSKAIRKL